LLLEVSPDHVEALSDTDLRELLGRLCEAEMVRVGHSTAAVTYGGDQNAADGGIDVRVEADGSGVTGYVPHDRTGFQAKAEDFLPSAIEGEMRPGGVLRPTIAALAAVGGAYIIASSKSSTADAARTRRLDAMRAALSDCPDAHQLETDFYDRQRLASWVNRHPGVAAWVRHQVGRPVPGWRGFEDWSANPSPTGTPFLLDGGLRLEGPDAGPGLNMRTGISRLRTVLSTPGGSARLTGLSGVGKTCLAGALFDSTIGTDALHPGLAVYADLGDDPDPVPLQMLEHLIRGRHRCVLVIDNCGAPLHDRLVRRLRTGAGGVSLLTIEYDISDDEPEGSTVFRLEPVSGDLIKRIVARHHPDLEELELATIARFSEGNARVALALASTARHGTSLANLRNGELFRRIFHQNKREDPDLLRTAKVLSLVYSFEGEDLESAGEMARLAHLAGQPVRAVYAQVAELRARKLVQKRGHFRALLPHALAHRLAAQALQGIPPADIQAQVADPALPRLLRSFSRRLGEFHDHPEAQVIVSAWLADGGRLGRVERLDEEDLILLDNVAPVDPGGALEAIEQAAARDFTALSAENDRVRRLVQLLRSIAYEPEFFDRAALLIGRLVGTVRESNNTSDPANVFSDLFRAALSGTQATPTQRAAFLRRIAAGCPGVDPTLAMVGLRAMLESYRFTSFASFEFGTRKRDFGWQTDTSEAILEWFGAAINLCHAFSTGGIFGAEPRRALAGQIRYLALLPGLDEEVARVARAIANDGGWPEVWARIVAARRDAEATGCAEVAGRLGALARDLAPSSVGDRIAIHVLPDDIHTMDAAEAEHPDVDDYEGIAKRHEAACREIGQELAGDFAERGRWLPTLLRGGGSGVGLVAEEFGRWVEEPEAVWREVREAVASLLPSERSTSFLAGFASGIASRDPGFAETLLDGVIADASLQFALVPMQLGVGLSARAASRLATAVTLPGVPTSSFGFLQYGGVTGDLTGAAVQEILEAVVYREGGLCIALEILRMWLYSLRQRGDVVTLEDRTTGRRLLAAAFGGDAPMGDTRTVAEVARACLFPGEDDAMVQRIIVCLCRTMRSSPARSSDLEEVVRVLGPLFPKQILSVFVGEEPVPGRASRFRSQGLGHRAGPLATIPPMEAVAWVKEGSSYRFERLAEAIQPWRTRGSPGEVGMTSEDRTIEWTETALALIGAAPDPLPTLGIFGRLMRPSSWSGSRAENLRRRLPLLDTLRTHPDQRVSDWAALEHASLEADVRKEEAWEAAQDREVDERFEW
jgi:hypothetical protein